MKIKPTKLIRRHHYLKLYFKEDKTRAGDFFGPSFWVHRHSEGNLNADITSKKIKRKEGDFKVNLDVRIFTSDLNSWDSLTKEEQEAASQILRDLMTQLVIRVERDPYHPEIISRITNGTAWLRFIFSKEPDIIQQKVSHMRAMKLEQEFAKVEEAPKKKARL